ncbi:MAG: class I SAM-dependent methyltransferase [Phycisphaerales bacterium]|nr:class I SAM-dependent methyltransferase [Phycisphaerales bacterium]
MSQSSVNSSDRFSGRVDDYARYRPHYPAEVIDWLRDEFGLSRERVVADVGAGTGIFTKLLLENGNRVMAVDPNAEMRAAMARESGANPNLTIVEGVAEATGLADGAVDWITAAQAFHWFDPPKAAAEFRRILRHDAFKLPRVVLLWNNRREDGPFLEGYEQFCRTHGTDYLKIKHQNAAADGRVEGFLGADARLRVFTHTARMDRDGAQGRTRSCSYIPGPGKPGYEAMLAALNDLFDRHQRGGFVDFVYDTHVYVGRPAAS